jgi:CBS domain-containing protein
MRALTAKDLMNPEVLAVPETMTVRELASFLVDNEISGAPVEDADGRLVGVVSFTDVAVAASEGGAAERERSSPDYFVRGWDESASPEELRGFHVEDGDTQVRDIMTPSVYSVTEDTPVAKVAETMIDSHIHRLLVTRAGRVVGIVSASDLLGLLVEKS